MQWKNRDVSSLMDCHNLLIARMALRLCLPVHTETFKQIQYKTNPNPNRGS